MNGPLLTDAELQKLGEQVRADLLANYDASAITNRSGTLRAALADARIEITNGSPMQVTVTLGDRVRPPRPGESGGVSTLVYGKVTFGWAAGRGRATPSRGNMRIGRSPVAGTRPANIVIMDLDATQTADVQAEIETRVADAIKRCLSR